MDPRRIRLWLMASIFCIAQVLIIAHTYTHALAGTDTTCKVCLLSSHAVPSVDTTSPLASLPRQPDLAVVLIGIVIARVYLWSGSPRSPPKALLID